MDLDMLCIHILVYNQIDNAIGKQNMRNPSGFSLGITGADWCGWNSTITANSYEAVGLEYDFEKNEACGRVSCGSEYKFHMGERFWCQRFLLALLIKSGARDWEV